MKSSKYNHNSVEKKWQDIWEKNNLFEFKPNEKLRKFYQLIEFPYPSGAGLHVGHIRSWSAMDAYVRRKRMQGFNVLYPIGWDAFGLPAENYAIKTGIHPSKTVTENIANFKKQIKDLGISFNWNSEINTTDPDYYRWTQWIFLELFKAGLAYRQEVDVNWCPKCKTNLADEEVMADGRHERCQEATEKRKQNQWLLAITKYADRLIDDLSKVDFSPSIRDQQINWIGRSEGAVINFPISPRTIRFGAGIFQFPIKVFTTRPDTMYGATFLVVSPQYAKENLLDLIPENKKEIVTKYIYRYINMSLRGADATKQSTEKTGEYTGLNAKNPATDREIPIYVSDYVLEGYGTGAIMAVPAHDQRDFDFAKKYDLQIFQVIEGGDVQKKAYSENGNIINSGNWNGLKYPDDYTKILSDIEEQSWGERSKSYHIHDWIFSRQHYWGEPIPMIFCEKCKSKSRSWFSENLQRSNPLTKTSKKLYSRTEGETGFDLKTIRNSDDNWLSEGWFPVPESDLPVKLPYMENYQPSGTGESPLINSGDWLIAKCPNCGSDAKRETDTMPNWAGSNWYFISYLIADKLKTPCFAKATQGKQNLKLSPSRRLYRVGDKTENIFSQNSQLLNKWLPVDFYQGGFEHTTLHLLYSRFIYKFLFDIGVVPTDEPYKKRRSHGIVLGSDNKKMSKSFGNVINPDEIVRKFGADTLRIYEMFIGPFDKMASWNIESLEGCSRFLQRVWVLANKPYASKTDKELLIKLHQTIKKVDSDIEELKFNTAVSSMMEFVNYWQEKEKITVKDAGSFIKLLAPFAPHLSEELFQMLFSKPVTRNTKPISILKTGSFSSVHTAPWPSFDPKLVIEETVTIPVQVNGKLRATIQLKTEDLKQKNEALHIAKEDEKVKKWLEGKNIIKEIYVEGRLINFVVN